MFIITDYEREFITKYLKNGKEKIKEAEMLNDLEDLLSDIDLDLVCGENGMDENFDLTDFGRKAQNIHDDIFFRNHDYDEKSDSYICNY